MKFTTTITALLCLLPLFSPVLAQGNNERGRGRGRPRGGFGGGNNGNNGGGNNGGGNNGGGNNGGGNNGGGNNGGGNNGGGNNGGGGAAPTQPPAVPPTVPSPVPGGQNGEQDPQTSLVLDESVLCTSCGNNGNPTDGQTPALTSDNNFINFCLTTADTPITNGQQLEGGSCNPIPIGLIPNKQNMPSSKFKFPTNQEQIPEGTPFDIVMRVRNFATGTFVNPQKKYFDNPQTLANNGQIIGHSHVVVEKLTSYDQTEPSNPGVFAFFKGLNEAAVNGELSASVADGLPAGIYRLSSINSSGSHQPAIAPVAQHGSLDDMVYFEVLAPGQGGAGNQGQQGQQGQGQQGQGQQGRQGGGNQGRQGGNNQGRQGGNNRNRRRSSRPGAGASALL